MKQNPSVPLLQELIRNSCVNTGSHDSGNEILSADTLRNFFMSYGIDSEIIESRKGRANLLVKVKGNNPALPSLMYMAHMDVVAANAENWSFDPFGGEVIDGCVCGRGAIDMLNMTAAMAAGLAEFIKENGRPENDLFYLAVADEEASGSWGAGWLTERHWDKVKCDYMVTELGGFSVSPVNDGKRRIGITVAEKGVSRYRLRTKGVAAHGSMPWKSDNALVKIAEIAASIGKAEFRVEPTTQYLEMVRSLVDDRSLAEMLVDPGRADLALEQLEDPGLARFIHSAGRMTVSPTILSSGNKDNIIPDSGELVIDVRSLPGYAADDIVAAILGGIGPAKAELEIVKSEFFPSNASSTDTPLYRAISSQVKAVHPDAEPAPLFISSVSDGRFWRKKGVQVYGFCMFESDMTMDRFSSMLHGVDEKISLASMDRAFEFYKTLPQDFISELEKE